VVVHPAAGYYVPDALVAVDDGAGRRVDIAFKPVTDATVYTKEAIGVYPILNLQAAIFVCSGYSTSNGIGGALLYSLVYGGAVTDAAGRGFLGFRWQEAVDQSTGLKARTEFRQDWPYVGLPSLVKKTQSSGAVLSQVVNTYSCTNPATSSACAVTAGNRYFPFASQSIETGADLNGAALPTVTTTTSYDAYGNATSVMVGTGDGYSKTTTNTFSNDVASWFLGRLTRSSVQSTSP
jgi:hypothetical protein